MPSANNWLTSYKLRSPEEIQSQGINQEWINQFAEGKMEDPWQRICLLQEIVEYGQVAVRALRPDQYALLTYLTDQGLIWHGAKITN